MEWASGHTFISLQLTTLPFSKTCPLHWKAFIHCQIATRERSLTKHIAQETFHSPNASTPLTMQASNRLQKALRTGSGLTFGACVWNSMTSGPVSWLLSSWQMLPGSNQARTIARCGFDWVLVDTEHGNIDGNTIIESCRTELYQRQWGTDT